MLRLYWINHPRFRYIKNCTANALFFDIGASNGGLSFWKEWLEPLRKDIKLYGIDLEIGEFASRYEKFEVIDLDKDNFPYGESFFTNIYSTHVIEHLKNPENMIQNIKNKLGTGGTVYLECPNKNSENTPCRQQFLDAGFVCSTMNFYDDKTHLYTYSKDDLETFFIDNKEEFILIEKGTIQNEYLADILISYGYNHQDQEITTYGLWLKFFWSDYVIIKKIKNIH